MKKVIVFGGSGLVGFSLVREFKARGCLVTSVSRSTSVHFADENILLDLTNSESLEDLPDISVYDLVINSMAITDVKLNETRYEAAFMLHVSLSRFLANKAKKYVYISSVAVYGESFSLDSQKRIKPTSWYSKTKYFGEPNSKHLCLRINVVGLESLTTRSLLEWAYQSLLNNEFITGFEDQHINPVLPEHVFKVCFKYLHGEIDCGCYDLGSDKVVSKYSLIKIIAKSLGKENLIIPGRRGLEDSYQTTSDKNQLIVELNLKEYVSRYLGQIKRA